MDDVLSGSAPDEEIWALAKARGAVIVTKDSEFRDRGRSEPAVQVLWVRSGNLKLAAFRPWFERRFDAALALLEEGERLVEMR